MWQGQLRAGLLAALILTGAGACHATELAVDLELVLAVDVSRSMDKDEQLLQRRGYAAAFRDPEVIAAIKSGSEGRIAVSYIEWGGARAQRVIVPWLMVGDAATAEALARAIEADSPPPLDRTSISKALEFSAARFAGNGIAGRRRVIDISGDGPNNAGGPVEAARDLLVADGIIINGLPIMTKPATSGGIFDYDQLDLYYRDCVIGGAGSFLVAVRSGDRFADAIKRKLLLEIAEPAATPRVVLVAAARARQDCLIGEKRWRSWIGPGGFEP